MGDSEGQEFFRSGPAKGDELITVEDLEKLQDEFKDRKGKHTAKKVKKGGGGNKLTKERFIYYGYYTGISPSLSIN